MSDPALELQAAFVGIMKGDPTVSGYVNDRVFDRVPQDAKMPYIRIADIQVIDDGAECFDFSAEVFIDVHVFTNSYGAVECRAIGSAIKTALHNTALPLVQWRAVDCRNRDSRVFAEGAGEIHHGVLNFRVLVDPQ